MLWPANSPDTEKYVLDLLPSITSHADSALKYCIRVTNLFNTLPRTSTLCLPVYTTLLKLASTNDELHVLNVSRAGIKKWLGK